jgi:hypothetical protein
MVQAARSVNPLAGAGPVRPANLAARCPSSREFDGGPTGLASGKCLPHIWLTGAKPERKMAMVTTSNDEQRELESEVLRRLITHLRERSDVQNIDLMTLAGFCRNCLANWYQDAAKARGRDISRDEARAFVYGMPYEEWKSKHQREATESQRQGFEKAHKGH